MPSFAIIPAAPILLPGVDLAEDERVAGLRAAIESQLATRSTWALPVDTMPPVAGLGGLGIDRGIDTRTGELLEGDEWVQAVTALEAGDRAACEAAHPAIAVALLHAHSAGVQVGALGSTDNLLIPIDLSVAAAADAPLSPVPGAAESDERLVQALTRGDAGTIAAAVAAADGVHADLELLDAAITLMQNEEAEDYSFTAAFDESVHDVRSLCGIGIC